MKKLRKWFFLIYCLISFSVMAENCDPFTAKCKMSDNALAKYNLSQLAMVGTITYDGKMFAIIKTPDKQVYPIMQGNLIGIEGGRVIKITSEQVMVDGEAPQSLWLQQVG